LGLTHLATILDNIYNVWVDLEGVTCLEELGLKIRLQDTRIPASILASSTSSLQEHLEKLVKEFLYSMGPLFIGLKLTMVGWGPWVRVLASGVELDI